MSLILRHHYLGKLGDAFSRDVVENMILGTSSPIDDYDKIELALFPLPLAVLRLREKTNRLRCGDIRLERVEHELHHVRQRRKHVIHVSNSLLKK